MAGPGDEEDIVSERPTREELIAVATHLHDDTGCQCDPKYLMSCQRMAAAILQAGQSIRDTRKEEPEVDKPDAAARAAGAEVKARVRLVHRDEALVELPGEDELVRVPAAEVSEGTGTAAADLPGMEVLVTVRENREEGRILSGFRLPG